MHARGALLVAVLALPLFALPAAIRAEEAEHATDAMLVEGKRVPLPPGAWRVLADAFFSVAPHAERAGSTAPLRSVVLGWILQQRVVALVVLRTNISPAAGGFGLDPDCRRRDLHLARVETPVAPTLAYCATIAHVLHGEARAGRADPAWHAALDALGRNGIAAPPAWLQVSMRFADQDDLLDVRYLFDPLLLGVPQPPEVPAAELAAGPVARLSARLGSLLGAATDATQPEDNAWARSGWGTRAVASDPARTWVVAQLVDWYEEALPELRLGFKGRGGALGWPRPWQVAFRLQPPSAAEPPGGRTSGGFAVSELTPRSEALWKTLSWRAVGSLLDVGVAYFFTGNAGSASGIAMLGGVVNSAAYYFHELVWRDIGASGSPADALTELPEVAIAR